MFEDNNETFKTEIMGSMEMRVKTLSGQISYLANYYIIEKKEQKLIF